MKVIKPIIIEDNIDQPVSDGTGGFCLIDALYESNVVLSLHGETIADSSINVKTMSAFGSAIASATQKKFGTKSIAVLNSGDFLSTPSSTDFNFTGDFTLECWVYRTVIKGAYAQGILTRREYNNIGSGTWRLMDDGFQNLQNPALVIGYTLPYNTWVHLAVTRASGVIRSFVQGIAGSSMTDTTNFTNSNQLLIGRDWDSSSTTAFGGYIDEVRITNGVARYTTSFTPPEYAGCNFSSVEEYACTLLDISNKTSYLIATGGLYSGTDTVFSDVTTPYGPGIRVGSATTPQSSGIYKPIPEKLATYISFKFKANTSPIDDNGHLALSQQTANDNLFVFIPGREEYYDVLKRPQFYIRANKFAPYVTITPSTAVAVTLGQWYSFVLNINPSSGIMTYSIHTSDTDALYASGTIAGNWRGLLVDVIKFGQDANVNTGSSDYTDVTICGTPTTSNISTLNYSSILEPTIGMDPAAWVSGTNYLLGSTVYLPSTHKVYQALTNITADTVSPDTSILLATPKWVEIGSTNKFAMFDLYRNTPSIFTTDTIIPRTVAGTLEVVNSAKVSVDVVSTDILSIALLNLVNVGRVIVQCVDNTTSAIISTISYDINTRDVYDWWTYFTTQFVPKKSLVLDTLPMGYSDMKVIVYFLGSPDIEVGSFILGTSTYIGMLQQGSELDVVNFSTMERDLFGNATLVPRRSISILKGELFIPKEIYEDVMNIKEELDAIPALWVGIEDIEDNYYQSLLLFGIYRDFNFKLDNPIGVVANLELEEM